MCLHKWKKKKGLGVQSKSYTSRGLKSGQAAWNSWHYVIQDRQVAENEDEIDDVVDQDDPYDDNLPQAEWEELFNGIHADDI